MGDEDGGVCVEGEVGGGGGEEQEMGWGWGAHLKRGNMEMGGATSGLLPTRNMTEVIAEREGRTDRLTETDKQTDRQTDRE